MPKNSSAARRQATRQMAVAYGISYTAARRRIQAASETSAREPDGIMQSGHLPPRETAEALLEQHRLHPAEVRGCQACHHVHLAHYGPPDERQRGCVACEETGSACPVFVPGDVPKLPNHADPVTADPMPCPWLCGHGLDKHADGSGCFRCGCSYGIPGVPVPGGASYHGYPANGPDGHVVVIEAPAGNPVSLLPHVSATQFAWGHGGAGPRELALCLLLAALGPAAACPACHGAAKTTLTAGGAPIPYSPALEDERTPETIIPCPSCDDGYRAVPHQKFKSQVVAAWDQGAQWVLDRAQIIAWLRAADPDLAAAATAWPSGG